MASYAGTGGDAIFGSTALNCKEWSATETANEIELTDKGDAGYFTSTSGVKKLEISIECDWDTTIHASGSAPLITSGSTGTFTLELSDAGDSLSGTMRVNSVEYSHPIDGVLSISISGTAQGAYYLPEEATS